MAHPAIAPLVGSHSSGFVEPIVRNEASSSGVSWAAVIGGAAVAAATSLILLALGTGVGLSSVSPWSNAGASAAAVGKTAIVWLIFSQIIASAMGGYLAGRLRTKWVNIHSDEVYFRDTAHGFLAWAVGIVITAAFLASAATSIVGAGVTLGGTAVAGAAMWNQPTTPGNRSSADGTAPRPEAQARPAESGPVSYATAYYTDALF